MNCTKVIPARLIGHKPNGGKAEVFLLHQIKDNTWKALVRPGRRCHIGTELVFTDGLTGTIVGYEEEQTRIIEFSWEGDFWQVLEHAGQVPLPPYIHHIPDAFDKEHYQTVYAKEKGSVAAPTAGLHFTQEILDRSLRRKWKSCLPASIMEQKLISKISISPIYAHKKALSYSTALLLCDAKGKITFSRYPRSCAIDPFL